MLRFPLGNCTARIMECPEALAIRTILDSTGDLSEQVGMLSKKYPYIPVQTIFDSLAEADADGRNSTGAALTLMAYVATSTGGV